MRAITLAVAQTGSRPRPKHIKRNEFKLRALNNFQVSSHLSTQSSDFHFTPMTSTLQVDPHEKRK